MTNQGICLVKATAIWALLNTKLATSKSAEMISLEEKKYLTILLYLIIDIITEIADEDIASNLWLKLKISA